MKKFVLTMLFLVSVGAANVVFSAEISKTPEVPEIPITELDWGIN